MSQNWKLHEFFAAGWPSQLLASVGPAFLVSVSLPNNIDHRFFYYFRTQHHLVCKTNFIYSMLEKAAIGLKPDVCTF